MYLFGKKRVNKLIKLFLYIATKIISENAYYKFE